jgi:hypothetical protein
VSDDDLEQVRRTVAADHGLPAGSESFLTGSTLAEVEASAATFAKLVEERRRESEPPVGVFERAAAAKAQRKRELVDLFSGRAPQPRDERGRYAASGRGFDGGTRTPVPVPQSPVEAHDEIVVQMARLSRAYGARF